MISWNINNKNVESISISNKEVSSIGVGNQLIYEKDDDVNSIVLTTDKSDIDVLTTGNPVKNKTVTFEVYKGSTLVDSCSGVSDDNGVATGSYTGNGYNSLSVKASVDEVISNTVSIMDYRYYDLGKSNSNKSNYTNVHWQGNSSSLANNGQKYYLDGYNALHEDLFLIDSLNGETNSLIFEAKEQPSNSTNKMGVVVYDDSDNYIILSFSKTNYYVIVNENGTPTETSNSLPSQIPTGTSFDWGNIKVIIDDDIEFYVQNNLLETITIPNNFITSTTKYGLYMYKNTNTSIYFADVRVKLLED